MNLRVDLILESEQRSASIINVKSLMRMGTIVVPALAITLAALALLSAMKQKSEERVVKQRWETLEPRQARAKELNTQLAENRRILGELAGWRASLMPWHEQLAGLVDVVPSKIQIEALQINQSLQLVEEETVPARVFTASMRGKAVGKDAERNVQILEKRLLEDEPFAGLVKDVKVPKYGADPSKNAGKDDRIFEITCAYVERKFEAEE